MNRYALYLGTLCIIVLAASSGRAASIAPGVSGDFNIEIISTSDIGQIGQLTFGPDGRLYAATRFDGIISFAYDPNGLLSDEMQASTRNSLGIAFHEDPVLGTVMYLTGTICFSPGTPPTPADQDIYRLTDSDGDGIWGETGEVNQRIARIWMSCYHQINQAQILGDTLYLAAGSRSNLGDFETQYGGSILWIKDLKLLSSDTSTTDIADFSIANTDAARYADTQALTSTAADKLIVHSKGLRNCYGIALDSNDRLWVSMNQTERGGNTPHDELYIGFEFADYNYPASNSEVPNWRTNADALAAGHFAAPAIAVTPTGDASVVPGGLGANAAVGGLDFVTSSAFPLIYQNDAFLARWVRSDVVAVDEVTGSITQIATGFRNCLDVQVDPVGNILVADAAGGGTRSIYRITAANPGANPPVIVDLSDSLVVDSGTTAVFEVTANDPLGGGLTYQWFFDPNPNQTNDEVALSDGTDISGATTDTLTIANIDSGKEGHYFCRVTNATTSVDTLNVALFIKACLYYWPLDGTAVEANGSGFDGTEQGDTSYATNTIFPALNQAVDLDGNGDYLSFGNVPLSPTGSFSISMWVMPRNLSVNWRGFASKWSVDNSQRSFWMGQHATDGWVRFGVYLNPNSGTQEFSTDTNQIILSNDTWAQVVCTYDGDVARIYIDGVLINQSGALNAPFLDRDGDFRIGSVVTPVQSIDGLIDEVRVYNYALSNIEIAAEYTTITGLPVCLDPDIFVLPNGRSVDLNDDCIIDLADFVILSGNWLACRLVPQTGCE